MYQLTIDVKNFKQLRDALSGDEVLEHKGLAQTILVMVYSAQIDKSLFYSISEIIMDFSSKVVLIGATTTGEIVNGNTVTHSTTVTLLFFETTEITPFAFKGGFGDENSMADTLRRKVDEINPTAVMLITTPLSSDVNIIIEAFTEKTFDFEIFGGGAGDYAMESSLLLMNNEVMDSGVIAVCFLGDSFQIEKHSFVGWQPMSKEMMVTRAKGTTVYTIDDKPAFDVYRHYLDIADDSNFFANALGFPMLTKTKGDYLARVPVNVGEGGSLEFVSDFKEREAFCLGFVNPALIHENINKIKSSLNIFAPEAIFLFSCGCRRFALLDDVQSETRPFAEIAPVSGFYTIGEFCNIGRDTPQMNLSFVAVGIKEGFNSKRSHDDVFEPKKVEVDKYITSPMTVVGRLLHFIKVLNQELEAQVITDSLTNLYNRRYFDSKFSTVIRSAKRNNKLLCFLMIDVDYFKRYNDSYGHQEGDRVLVEVATCLRKNIKRADDYCFRLGGEEFGIVFKADSKEHALTFANSIRESIENLKISHTKSEVSSYITVSMGLACREANTIVNEDAFYKEADILLYQAKEMGRNRVEFSSD
jgi:diguanylate cyclase (GGDEF)-like protein